MPQAPTAKLSLSALLAPLPPLSSFGANGRNGCVGRDSAAPTSGTSDKPPPAKRPRIASPLPVASSDDPRRHQPNDTRIPASVAAAVDAVRRAGVPADTLFFAAVPPELSTEAALRAAISTPLRDLKILRSSKPGVKTLAWVTFFNEADCVSALVSLRRVHPALNPRLHKPKAGGGTAGPGAAASASAAGAPSMRDVFEIRAAKIVAEGGQANTVMLRGLPLEVSGDEVADVVLSLLAERPLRVRTAEGKSGKVRNFWLTYASRTDACEAFAAISGAQAAFRCGRTMRLAPVVHNDATDAEGMCRIARDTALAAAMQTSVRATRGGRSHINGNEQVRISGDDGIVKLESLLRKQGRLYFMDMCEGYP
jgi:hypothetical protein